MQDRARPPEADGRLPTDEAVQPLTEDLLNRTEMRNAISGAMATTRNSQNAAFDAYRKAFGD